MSPPRAITYEAYVEQLRRLVNSRRPGEGGLEHAPRAQQIEITAWLTTLQRYRPYQAWSQLGSWERQEHFFAVVGRVSLTRVPLVLPTIDELFHLAATTFAQEQQSLHHASPLAGEHAAGPSHSEFEPAARDARSAIARRHLLNSVPRLHLPPGPLAAFERVNLTTLNPVAHRSMYPPRRYDTIPPPDEPWDHDAAWPDAHSHHAALDDDDQAFREEDAHFREAWHDGLERR